MSLNNHDSNLSGGDRSDSSAAVSRREFLGMTAATVLIGGSLSADTKPDKRNGIPYRPLGRTGESVSLVGLGGYHLGTQSTPEESIRIIRTGLDKRLQLHRMHERVRELESRVQQLQRRNTELEERLNKAGG